MVRTEHPLLPSPAPSYTTPPQLFQWSLQDDQNVSLHTCHVLKRSRWKIDQLVLIRTSTCAMLCQDAQCGNMSLSAKKGFLNDKIMLGLFGEN